MSAAGMKAYESGFRGLGENMKKILAVLAVLMALSGCSIRHQVVKDYPQYLINGQGESKLPATNTASHYEITPSTAAHHYEFRSAMAGYANVWVVEFGKVLEATLQSQDVQKAFDGLVEGKGNGAGPARSCSISRSTSSPISVLMWC